jgi:hypothetical protein
MRLLLFLSSIVAASSLSASRITTTPSSLSTKVASFRDRAPLPDLRNGLVGGLIACGVVLGGCEQAEALQPADVVELTDAAYPIIRQLTAPKFQPFADKVADLLLQAGELPAAVDAGLDYFNSMPTAAVSAAVADAFDGLDPESCARVPLPTRATFDKVAAKASVGVDATKLKKFADAAGPAVAALKVRDDGTVCLPPVDKLEKAALAPADAAKAADVAAGTRFNKQAYKSAGGIPKGPAIKLFTSYDAAKQSLGASSQDRARFEKAGKKVEAAATALQRQASYTY